MKNVCWSVMKKYRISARFVGEALIPALALDCDFKGDNKDASFVTSDGVTVKLVFLSTMNNAQDFCEELLEHYCRTKYGMSFRRIEDMWSDRLGRLDDWWHVIKMERI